MNHDETYARIQAGDFEGERDVAGNMRRSIFLEYAEAGWEEVADFALAWAEKNQRGGNVSALKSQAA